MAKKVKFRFRQLRREKAAKEERQITLKEVSLATGISMSALSKLESGGSKGVEFGTLNKLATYYDVASAADIMSVEEARRARRAAKDGTTHSTSGVAVTTNLQPAPTGL